MAAAARRTDRRRTPNEPQAVATLAPAVRPPGLDAELRQRVRFFAVPSRNNAVMFQHSEKSASGIVTTPSWPLSAPGVAEPGPAPAISQLFMTMTNAGIPVASQ